MLAAFAVLLAALAGCAGGADHSAAQTSRSAATASDGVVGTASWYGRGHHGRKTASGERFNMNALTAAHPTLPFGTQVAVTNLDNGRTVMLRINDRGPFIRGRIIDVSYRAAQDLGMVREGLARVRVQVQAVDASARR